MKYLEGLYNYLSAPTEVKQEPLAPTVETGIEEDWVQVQAAPSKDMFASSVTGFNKHATEVTFEDYYKHVLNLSHNYINNFQTGKRTFPQTEFQSPLGLGLFAEFKAMDAIQRYLISKSKPENVVEFRKSIAYGLSKYLEVAINIPQAQRYKTMVEFATKKYSREELQAFNPTTVNTSDPFLVVVKEFITHLSSDKPVADFKLTNETLAPISRLFETDLKRIPAIFINDIELGSANGMQFFPGEAPKTKLEALNEQFPELFKNPILQAYLTQNGLDNDLISLYSLIISDCKGFTTEAEKMPLDRKRGYGERFSSLKPDKELHISFSADRQFVTFTVMSPYHLYDSNKDETIGEVPTSHLAVVGISTTLPVNISTTDLQKESLTKISQKVFFRPIRHEDLNNLKDIFNSKTASEQVKFKATNGADIDANSVEKAVSTYYGKGSGLFETKDEKTKKFITELQSLNNLYKTLGSLKELPYDHSFAPLQDFVKNIPDKNFFDSLSSIETLCLYMYLPNVISEDRLSNAQLTATRKQKANTITRINHQLKNNAIISEAAEINRKFLAVKNIVKPLQAFMCIAATATGKEEKTKEYTQFLSENNINHDAFVKMIGNNIISFLQKKERRTLSDIDLLNSFFLDMPVDKINLLTPLVEKLNQVRGNSPETSPKKSKKVSFEDEQTPTSGSTSNSDDEKDNIINPESTSTMKVNELEYTEPSLGSLEKCNPFKDKLAKLEKTKQPNPLQEFRKAGLAVTECIKTVKSSPTKETYNELDQAYTQLRTAAIALRVICNDKPIYNAPGVNEELKEVLVLQIYIAARKKNIADRITGLSVDKNLPKPISNNNNNNNNMENNSMTVSNVLANYTLKSLVLKQEVEGNEKDEEINQIDKVIKEYNELMSNKPEDKVEFKSLDENAKKKELMIYYKKLFDVMTEINNSNIVLDEGLESEFSKQFKEILELLDKTLALAAAENIPTNPASEIQQHQPLEKILSKAITRLLVPLRDNIEKDNNAVEVLQKEISDIGGQNQDKNAQWYESYIDLHQKLVEAKIALKGSTNRLLENINNSTGNDKASLEVEKNSLIKKLASLGEEIQALDVKINNLAKEKRKLPVAANTEVAANHVSAATVSNNTGGMEQESLLDPTERTNPDPTVVVASNDTMVNAVNLVQTNTGTDPVDGNSKSEVLYFRADQSQNDEKLAETIQTLDQALNSFRLLQSEFASTAAAVTTLLEDAINSKEATALSLDTAAKTSEESFNPAYKALESSYTLNKSLITDESLNNLSEDDKTIATQIQASESLLNFIYLKVIFNPEELKILINTLLAKKDALAKPALSQTASAASTATPDTTTTAVPSSSSSSSATTNTAAASSSSSNSSFSSVYKATVTGSPSTAAPKPATNAGRIQRLSSTQYSSKYAVIPVASTTFAFAEAKSAYEAEVKRVKAQLAKYFNEDGSFSEVFKTAKEKAKLTDSGISSAAVIKNEIDSKLRTLLDNLKKARSSPGHQQESTSDYTDTDFDTNVGNMVSNASGLELKPNTLGRPLPLSSSSSSSSSVGNNNNNNNNLFTTSLSSGTTGGSNTPPKNKNWLKPLLIGGGAVGILIGVALLAVAIASLFVPGLQIIGLAAFAVLSVNIAVSVSGVAAAGTGAVVTTVGIAAAIKGAQMDGPTGPVSGPNAQVAGTQEEIVKK